MLVKIFEISIKFYSISCVINKLLCIASKILKLKKKKKNIGSTWIYKNGNISQQFKIYFFSCSIVVLNSMYRIKTEINYGIQLNCKVGKFKGSQGKYFVWIILWIIIKKKKKMLETVLSLFIDKKILKYFVHHFRFFL